MRVSRTLLVLAALLSLAACGSASGDLLAPGDVGRTLSERASGGPGQIGSGNIVSAGTDSSFARSGAWGGSGN